jgi:hypothetical protein
LSGLEARTGERDRGQILAVFSTRPFGSPFLQKQEIEKSINQRMLGRKKWQPSRTYLGFGFPLKSELPTDGCVRNILDAMISKGGASHHPNTRSEPQAILSY